MTAERVALDLRWLAKELDQCADIIEREPLIDPVKFLRNVAASTRRQASGEAET